MLPPGLSSALLVVAAGVSLLLAAFAAARRRPDGGSALAVSVFALAAAVGALLAAAFEEGWLPPLAGTLGGHLRHFTAAALAMAFVYLTRLFTRQRERDGHAYAVGGLIGLAAGLLSGGAAGPGDVLWRGAGWEVRRDALVTFGLVFAWGLFTTRAILATQRAYRRAAQPLHRNRLAVWALAVTLTVLGATLLFGGQVAIGHAVYALAVVVATVAVLSHRLPDLRRMVQLSGRVVVNGVVLTAVYSGVFLAARAAFAAPSGLLPAGTALLLALAVVLAVNPLLRGLERWLDRLITGEAYDARRIVGEYSVAISNILDLDRLAETALGVIHQALGIQHGTLFLVDRLDETAGGAYALRPLRGHGQRPMSAGTLLAGSPLVDYLTNEFAPLTQYDVDFHPRFREVSAAERVWLTGLGMDVFVPIYAERRWIGLFALGPKLSRHRYFDHDLQLLCTLADQTAVALQNARLVADLVALNAEIRAANQALDTANHNLAQLDRAKMDFINIVSHELRTPLSILHGYSHVLHDELARNGAAELLPMVEGIRSGSTRMHEVIDSMLDVAKIDSRALRLDATPVALADVVAAAAAELEPALAERRLRLDVTGLGDLPPIEADREALGKVVRHLLGNAIKFTPDEGAISVTGAHAPDDLPGGAVRLVVSDTGIGIDPRFIELIFTKFYQTGEVALHSSGKTKFKGGGPGLGLAIARGIVEAHGGRIWAESPGYDEAACPGSQFIVLLPLRQSQSSA